MSATSMDSQKSKLRHFFLEKRANIAHKKRLFAEHKAIENLEKILQKHSFVLSYCSKDEEFPTENINQFLEKQGKLVLPKINGLHLETYLVKNAQTDLLPGPFSLLEPNPQRCQMISKEHLSLVLVPGIVFDNKNRRLGYGKGYYDRFLSTLPKNAKAIGLGFIEQLFEDTLPQEDTDQQLNHLLLL